MRQMPAIMEAQLIPPTYFKNKVGLCDDCETCQGTRKSSDVPSPGIETAGTGTTTQSFETALIGGNGRGITGTVGSIDLQSARASRDSIGAGARNQVKQMCNLDHLARVLLIPVHNFQYQMI
jgi:hypothetical protein